MAVRRKARKRRSRPVDCLSTGRLRAVRAENLLLIGSLLDNRDGSGSGVGRRSPRSSRLGVFALWNHLCAGCAVQVAICPIREP